MAWYIFQEEPKMIGEQTRSLSAIKTAYQFGIRHFGKNRSRELESKVLELEEYPDMAPMENSAIITRKIFQRTRDLSIWLKNIFPAENFSNLSMGMSGDFEMAIEEGATHIRIGGAIFA